MPSPLPLAYVLLATIYLAGGGQTGWLFGVVHGLMMLAIIVFFVGSILHIARNESLSSDGKLTWVLLVLFMGFVTLPVYWYVIVGRGDCAGATSASA